MKNIKISHEGKVKQVFRGRRLAKIVQEYIPDLEISDIKVYSKEEEFSSISTHNYLDGFLEEFYDVNGSIIFNNSTSPVTNTTSNPAPSNSTPTEPIKYLIE